MDPAMHPHAPVDLTLREAAELYQVTVKTLAHHLRCGQLLGHKTGGATGREWRVTRGALDDAGYRARADGAAEGSPAAEEVARLREDLRAARRAVSAERRRADDLDRRLGHALLECGRLRTALTLAAGGQEPAEPDLDPGTARWLITAITGGATIQTRGVPTPG